MLLRFLLSSQRVYFVKSFYGFQASTLLLDTARQMKVAGSRLKSGHFGLVLFEFDDLGIRSHAKDGAGCGIFD